MGKNLAGRLDSAKSLHFTVPHFAQRKMHTIFSIAAQAVQPGEGVGGTTGVSLNFFLMVSAALFCIGFIGVLTRRNILVIFMSAELMMNAVNLSLIAFGTSLNSMAGQNFVVFVVTVAAAEAAVGLAIIISLVRQKPTIDTTDIDIMKD